ncbi:restriction endonuclease [Luteimonas sp. RD2P54]|uniref:Restriction endonuclease n=1 Tax=Luteimonas endophytica TaxID=3042023 RepID=A0ABT6J911_9GAMM|nr:restriction endonuclease [Luteimonas endophytica]MDH5822698.1 restriction endonuclease [Luteimonas endophytica]
MGRGRRGLLDELAVLPWPVGLAVGVLGYLLIRHGIPAWAAGRPGPLGQALGSTDAFAPLAWIVLAACATASLFSWLGSRRKRRLLDAQSGLASIAALGWRDFERLVGEAFRRQGYTVEESGLGGADGGIDLILRKDGQRTLVQCKQWQRRKVPVNVVREMYGLLAHHGAHAVQIATVGGFTSDAARFAQGRRITLIDGETLLGMLRAVQARNVELPTRIEPVIQSNQTASPAVPECPRCGAQMVERRNRSNGDLFWGCATYPGCRGTR